MSNQLIEAAPIGVDVPTLDQVLARYFLTKTKITSAKTREHYRRAARWLGEMLGRPATILDLNDEYIAALMRWLVETRKQAAETVNTSRKCLAALWRWCLNRGFLRTGPTVEPLKVPVRIPRAWTPEQLGQLIEAARTTNGTLGGMPARTWWLTLLVLEMDTGARAGELLALKWEWIDWENGHLTVPAEVRKGGMRDAVYGLLPDTLAWLAKIRKPEGPILNADGMHVSTYYQAWRRLLERAGLPSGRKFKTQALRRTFATMLERFGGNATDALGHQDRGTTTKHYLDPTGEVKRHAEKIPLRVLSLAGESK